MPVHTPRGVRSPFLKVLVALVTTLLLAVGTAPAQAAPPLTSPVTWTVKVGQQSQDGAIQGMAFAPQDISINVGDTVHWVANSMEIHTVSFFTASTPAVPFDPAIGYMVTPTPQTTISAPGQFRNSGVMSTDPADIQHYNLTFTGTGDYHYVCYVHGAMMVGTVHVRPAGTPYPSTQQNYDAQAAKIAATVRSDGVRLRAKAQAAADNHHVFVGAADQTALVMRFIRPTVYIRTGEQVTFDMGRNSGVPIPHTVTFGPEPADLAPHGDPSAYSGGALSSGLMLPPPYNTFAGVPSTFTVTFTQPGTYHYLCMLHDTMGMVGDVVVQ
ncbi:plastocyanin/azurin family copper-binding protein [Raineyella sp. LH-20]|uniref:cupredoxin domain-containing protein n=1 Tax=Raineyella sp. LH-20 TaxID=3081204 RepID=UPI002953F569|nr:plastocyanin/azurin family copper-binding protein [Raineyella sp. LH-20]WOP18133.1 plastocyanin/azurin family copper-binding protein [Raineyella sp. LH-20]